MEQQPLSQVKAPSFVPVFLPALVVGHFEPKELAVIVALQWYGASVNRVELSYTQLSRATKITRGAIPLLISRLEEAGIVSKQKTINEETRKTVYHFKLNIWEWSESLSA